MKYFQHWNGSVMIQGPDFGPVPTLKFTSQTAKEDQTDLVNLLEAEGYCDLFLGATHPVDKNRGAK